MSNEAMRKALEARIESMVDFAPHHTGNGMKRGGDYVRNDDVIRELRSALAQAEKAETVVRPCHVFTITKNGALTEWEPTNMAFALPDGKHALYTSHQPAQQEVPKP